MKLVPPGYTVRVKFVFKWALRLFLLLVVLVVVLFLARNAILRALAERRIREATGMETHISRFEIGLTAPVVHLENLRLYNTPEFGGALYLDIPELHVEYDPGALVRGKMKFKLVRFNFAELNVVRNAAGQLNVKRPPRGGKPGGPGRPGAGGKRPDIFEGIEKLQLTLGKVSYTDMKTPANNRLKDLGVRDEVFKNLKTEEDLSGVMGLLMLRGGLDMMRETGGFNPLKLF